MTELATMDFHPQPQAGEAKPWAFPAPERGTLDNGLTVLRCHRPGQQVVAVEVSSTPRWTPSPTGLDGVATIMARALSEGTDKHSAEEFAAELERCGATLDAHADHPGVRVSPGGPRLPAAQGARPARRRPARARLRRQRGRAAGAQPARRDPARAGQPGPPRRQGALQGAVPGRRRACRARARAPRRPSQRIDAAAVRAFYEAHVRPATATAVVVGDLDRRRPGRGCSPTPWAPGRATPAAAAAGAADHRRRHRPRGHRGPAGRRADAAADRPHRRRPARPRLARAGARHLLPGRHPHLPAGPGAARGEGLHLRRAGLRPGAALAPPGRHRAPRCWPSAARSTPRYTGPALDDLWKVLRTLAAEGLTDAERDVAVQNLVGVAPLKYETAAAVAGTLADQVEQHLPGRLPGAAVRGSSPRPARWRPRRRSSAPSRWTGWSPCSSATRRRSRSRCGRSGSAKSRVVTAEWRRRRVDTDARLQRRPRRRVRRRDPCYARIGGEVACLPCGMRYKNA